MWVLVAIAWCVGFACGRWAFGRSGVKILGGVNFSAAQDLRIAGTSVPYVHRKARSVTVTETTVVVDGVVYERHEKRSEIAVNIDGSVDGSLLLVNGRLTLIGPIQGDIDARASEVTCGAVAGDANVSSGNLRCGDIGGDLTCRSGNVEQCGNVNKNVQCSSGNLSCLTVGGAVNVLSGNVNCCQRQH
jgi:hypothetical protein